MEVSDSCAADLTREDEEAHAAIVCVFVDYTPDIHWHDWEPKGGFRDAPGGGREDLWRLPC